MVGYYAKVVVDIHIHITVQENEAQQPSIPNSSYPGESSDEDYILPIEPKTYMEDARKILFPTKEMAEEVAEMLGCSGSHEHKVDTGESYWMPCETHPENE